MRYRTPNIDRLAAEGVRFTDYYGEQSCTAAEALQGFADLVAISGGDPHRVRAYEKAARAVAG